MRGCDLIHNKSLIPFPRWWCVKHTDANRAGRWLKRKEGVGTENKKKRGKSFKFSNLWTGRWRNTADRGEIEDLKKHTITWHLLYVFKRKEKISLATLVLTTRHESSSAEVMFDTIKPPNHNGRHISHQADTRRPHHRPDIKSIHQHSSHGRHW